MRISPLVAGGRGQIAERVVARGLGAAIDEEVLAAHPWGADRAQRRLLT